MWTIHRYKARIIFIYCEAKDNREVEELTRTSIFLKNDSFLEANLITVSRNGKGISASATKSKYASSTLTVFELMPNRFYPHGEIAKSPVVSLHPPWGCWIHDAKQSSSITHHWQDITVRDLSTILTRGTLRNLLQLYGNQRTTRLITILYIRNKYKTYL